MAEANGSIKFSISGEELQIEVDGEIQALAAVEAACWCMEQVYYLFLSNDNVTLESMHGTVDFMKTLPVRAFYRLLNDGPEDKKHIVEEVLKQIVGGYYGGEEEVEADPE